MTFKSGEEWQGNAKGRPLGTGYRQQIFNDLVLPHKEALIEKALSLAKEGDPHMLRLFLERLLPPKPTDDTLPLLSDEKMSYQKAQKFGEKLAVALKNGEITPNQAQAALGVLKGLSGI